MRIIVPFTRLRPETYLALEKTDYDYETEYVGISDDAYWTLLAKLWKAGEAFIIVEHDIVPTETALFQLAACDQDWCAWPYDYFSQAYGLACMKFEAELISRHPNLIEQIAQMSDTEHPPKHWCRLDAWLERTLWASGEPLHRHIGEPLRHIRDEPGPAKPSHGCVLPPGA
jgi:hypothetical protein